MSVHRMRKLLTAIGAILAIVSLMTIITSTILSILTQSEPIGLVLAEVFTPAILLLIGLAGMLGSALLARRQGLTVRLWMLGLDGLRSRHLAQAGYTMPSELLQANTEQDNPSASDNTPTKPHNKIKDDMPFDQRKPYQPKFPPMWNNFISYTGFFVSLMSMLLMLTFGLFSMISTHSNPYVDIIGYLVLPSVLIAGLAFILCGIFIKSWRLKRTDPTQKLIFRFPRVDFNDPIQRRAAKVVLASCFILLPVVGVSSYHGYHYTDSADFCAKACHAAMEPQATAYEYSAHARVSCAECHIGSGASWFVKSKLSGTRQVLAMWQDSFSRPIPPAITELRPARETCEKCHWPKKFFGQQLRRIVHYRSDEDNTRLEFDMLLKTGGGDESMGRAEGIHMHMALEGKIEYVANDDKLQDISWVRYVDRTGVASIYRNDGNPSSDPRPKGVIRRLDCMDCHNRPAHKFKSPKAAIDIFLEVGRIDTTLPFIKREALAALVEPYPDRETAEREIGRRMLDFYKNQYPNVWDTRKASVKQAIDMTRLAYRKNFFPDMKVDWRTYPDNIGHKISPGCFRCHDGLHINQRGERLSHECSTCHTFLNPIDENGRNLTQEGEFQHPYELEGSHISLRCDKCHTGGITPSTSCQGCHTTVVNFRAGTLAEFELAALEPDAMVDVDCESCHDLSEPTSIESIDVMCMDCHDGEEGFEGMLASWAKEAETLLSHAQEKTKGDTVKQNILHALRKAGPMHNMKATRSIVRELLSSENAATNQTTTTTD